jgi:hypothetical protein
LGLGIRTVLEAFMIILKEKQQLDEMAILVVSSIDDGLPFRVTVQSPDHQPPHAHVRDLETGKTELGEFLIFKGIPRKPEDIKNYAKGIPDEWRPLIVQWAKNKCTDFPVATNWDMLNFLWSRNEIE